MKCRPSRPPIPEEREINRLHAEAVKKRKEAAETTTERKKKRKAKHDKACKIARAEGKPRPATPESTDEEEEDTSDAEAHLPGGDEAATGADSPPVYQEAGDRCGFPAGGKARNGAVDGPTPHGGGTEVTHAGGGTRVTRTSSGWRIDCASGGAGVAPASDRRGGPRAHDVGGRRWVRGEHGSASADGLKASGSSEGDTLESVFEGRRRASGPKEWHGQTQHECPVQVNVLGFVCCIR